jgi:hypothetical protein
MSSNSSIICCSLCEDVAFLLDAGESPLNIPARLRVKERTILHRLHKHRHSGLALRLVEREPLDSEFDVEEPEDPTDDVVWGVETVEIL